VPAVRDLFRPDGEFFLIAGPCAIESREQVLETARELAVISRRIETPIIFKASYLKDNRTRGDAYRGPGLEEGLRLLEEAKRESGLSITSDVHTVEEALAAAEALDSIQIPAFLCRQTRLLEAAAGTGVPLNVKKGQFLSPSSVSHVVDKVRRAGATAVAITERGASFGYGDLVVDPRVFPSLNAIPVCSIFDATHSMQQPGGASTGGNREYLEPVTRAALAAGARGVFVEVHPNPEQAKSDRDTQIPLAEAGALFDRLSRFARAVREESRP
jgi:2-dehydro-3-deoxyphosphooctonate aldolase (KDO 8-P synthase)